MPDVEALAPGGDATVAESWQPERPDVFVSYSRVDRAFIETLVARFDALERDAWVDSKDIEPSADWWLRIEKGIESAKAFVAVLSPDQLDSDVCARELEVATAGGKRIIPLLRRDVDESRVPEALGRPNWILARDRDDLEVAFAQLLEAIDTDLEWLDRHARLLVRAREWERGGKNSSFLLRGSDLDAAEAWLAEQDSHREAATPLQAAYLVAGRRAETQRLRLRLSALTVALLVAAVLTAIAVVERRQAEKRADIAQSREYATTSASLLDSDPALAVGVARAAVRVRATPEAVAALRAGLAAAQPSVGTPELGITHAALDRAGRYLVTGSRDGKVRVWKVRPLRLLRTIAGPPDPGCAEDTVHVDFTPDGRFVAAARCAILFVWNWRTAALLYTADSQVASHADGPLDDNTVKFSPRGDLLAWAYSRDYEVWNWRHDHLVRAGRIRSFLGFSTERAIVIQNSSHARLVPLPNGNSRVLAHVPPGLGDAAYGRGGSIAAAEHGEIQISRPGRARPVALSLNARTVEFGPHGGRLLAALRSGVADIIDWRTGTVLLTLHAHKGGIREAHYSPGGSAAVTVGYEGSARVWPLALGAGFTFPRYGYRTFSPHAALERLSKCVLRVEQLEADQAAADREERLVDVVAALITDAQPAVLVQPGDGALDNPPLLPEPGAMTALRPRDLRLDVAAAQFAAARA